jgi:hypothetical protein
LSLVFAALSVGLFSIQVGLAVASLSSSHEAGLARALAFVIVALFGSAVARGWEVAGIGRRSPHSDLR